MTNRKKWFQFKELSAGKNRLLISYYLYKIFGVVPLKIIAFFVVIITFFKATEQRAASERYFKILEQYTQKSYRPYLFSSLRQFLNYGNSLVDKIVSFSGNINPTNFHFLNKADRDEIDKILRSKKGIFFLTAHIGNIEVLRSLLQTEKISRPAKVNIFMDRNYCKIFTEFLKNIAVKSNTETHSIEDIGLDTAIILSEKLEKGEIIFMAGDRIAKTNPEKTVSANFLNKDIRLPIGAQKLAVMLNSPIYFIVCAKTADGFDICTKKFEYQNLSKKEIFENLKTQYGSFLEECTLKYPFQFFNFFDIFTENDFS